MSNTTTSNDGSGVSMNTGKVKYCNLIYNSEILKLTIFQDNYERFEGYNPKYNNNLTIRFTGLEKELSREDLTTYILSMLDNRLKRVRLESINFIKYFNRILTYK